MEKEFIPYEQALELKELSFNELCFMQWTYSPDLIFCVDNWGNPQLKTNKESYSASVGDCISAPLYQQAFRWFREKYDLFISITHYENGYSINDLRRFDTYEEAELACLKKLIEIVKNNQNK
jgi:hypothetical protein